MGSMIIKVTVKDVIRIIKEIPAANVINIAITIIINPIL
jgi:hypothetical protein